MAAEQFKKFLLRADHFSEDTRPVLIAYRTSQKGVQAHMVALAQKTLESEERRAEAPVCTLPPDQSADRAGLLPQGSLSTVLGLPQAQVLAFQAALPTDQLMIGALPGITGIAV